MSSNKLIINADELQQLMQKETLRIVDLRAAYAYLDEHIEGAIHFDLSHFNYSAPPVNGLLPTVEQFNAAISQLALNPEQWLIAYDDSTSPVVGRFVWTMLAYGHKQVSILDGGYSNWKALGKPTSRRLSEIQPIPYSGQLQNSRIADSEYILRNQKLCIVDNRSQAEYYGKDVRSSRGGHIPGAVNLNWELTKSNKNPALIKSELELMKMLEKNGITKDKEIVCYCQSHQRSALVCVLLENLGYKMVRGYPGAWSDWGNRADTPIEL